MVYAEAARYMVQGTNHLDILLFCRHWGVEEPLPSWVPDWLVPYEIQGPHEKWHLEKHDASGGTSAVASFSPDLKVLRVKSILLGLIKSAIPWNHCLRGLTGPNIDGYEKITSAGEIEIFRWMAFRISSFDEGGLEGYNQRSEEEKSIRAIFDALTYGRIGQLALISMWSFEKFFTYYLRLSYKSNKRLGCDIPIWKAEISQILEGLT
jgi:hypothetical protein